MLLAACTAEDAGWLLDPHNSLERGEGLACDDATAGSIRERYTDEQKAAWEAYCNAVRVKP